MAVTRPLCECLRRSCTQRLPIDFGRRRNELDSALKYPSEAIHLMLPGHQNKNDRILKETKKYVVIIPKHFLDMRVPRRKHVTK